MLDNSYVYLHPDKDTAFIDSEQKPEFNERLFLLSHKKIKCSKSEEDLLLYELGLTSLFTKQDDTANDNKKKQIITAENDVKYESQDVQIKKSTSELLTEKTNSELTKLIFLVKRSKNIELLRRMRKQPCIVLAKIEDSSVTVYENEMHEVPVFSSALFLRKFLEENAVLTGDGYAPLLIRLHELDAYISDTEKIVYINPISFVDSVHFSFKLTPQIARILYED
jgi:hypothetical protein